MPNWGQLYAQGRCKAVGIPWSEEEATAVFTLKIPAPFVRRGALTLEAFEAMKESDAAHLKGEGALPLAAMNHTELLSKAQELKVEVTSAASDADLISVIEQSTPEPEEKPKKKK